MRKFRVTFRIYLLALMPILALIGGSVFFTSLNYESLKQQRVGELERLVDIAISEIMRERAATAAAGGTMEEADARALQSIATYRYGTNDYFYVYEGTVTRMHGAQPELVGKDLGAVTDENGVAFVKVFAETVAKEGASTLTYRWPRPGSDVAVPKIGYARMIPGTNMWVGTGVYMDDLEAGFWTQLKRFLLVTALLTPFLIFVSYLVARSIVKPVEALKARMLDLKNGDVDSPVPDLGQRDEIGEMAQAVENFREQAVNVNHLSGETRRLEQQAEAERQQMLAKLRQSFGEVVLAAGQGDFSRRIEERFEDETLNEMCDGLNQLTSTVDTGVNDALAVISSMAEGDLSQKMDGAYTGKFQELKINLNGTIDQLNQMMSRIMDVSQTIVGGMSTIASGSEDLADRAEQQASALEETAATMEEMSATVMSNAQTAEEVNKLTTRGNEDARTNETVLREAVEAMEKIQESSSHIADITSVIDSIAFQTNLLALNAAVEAARAGEAGKGFAVVASEVRDLAQRSSNASQDIRKLIDTETTHVQVGAELVGKAGKAFSDNRAIMQQSAQSLADIARANREQASGVTEVSSTINQLDQITQENAALAERSASGARAMTDQSLLLRDVVSQFQLLADTSADDESGDGSRSAA